MGRPLFCRSMYRFVNHVDREEGKNLSGNDSREGARDIGCRDGGGSLLLAKIGERKRFTLLRNLLTKLEIKIKLRRCSRFIHIFLIAWTHAKIT